MRTLWWLVGGIALLAAGLFINVGVSWLIAASLKVHVATASLEVASSSEPWQVYRLPPPRNGRDVMVWRGRGWRLAVSSEYDRRDRQNGSMSTLATGWPFPSMRAAWWSPWESSVQSTMHGIKAPQGMVARGWFVQSGGRVPSDILVRGFVANSAMYSAMLALMVFLSYMLLRLRRALRILYGRCYRCGYELRDLQRCPECGTPVRHGCNLRRAVRKERQGGAPCPECGAAAPNAPVARASSPRSAEGRSEEPQS